MTANFLRMRPLFAAAAVITMLLLARGPASAPQASAACADTVLVRTVKRYSLTSGSQVTHIDTCTAIAVPGRRFLLEVLRPSASNPLDSARVTYGGVEYFGSHDVDASNVLLSRTITPKGTATLKATLYGSAGAKLDLRITQVPEPLFQAASQSGLSGASSSADKWYTRYFSPVDGVPATPHVMVLTNGNVDSTGSARTLESEVWLNSSQVIFPGEVTRGRAYITRNVTLEENNTLEVKLQGQQSGKTMSVKFYATDVTPPDLVVIAPTDSLVTRAAKVLASAQPADSQTGTRLWVDGVEKALTNGVWSDSLTLPTQDGLTTYTFVGVNGACLTDTVRRTVIRDTQPPTLEVLAPAPSGSEVASASAQVQFRVRVVDVTRTSVWLDGSSIGTLPMLVGTDTLEADVPLDIGPNGIVVRAIDAAGNTTEFKHYVFRSTGEAAHEDSLVDETPIALTEVGSFRDQIAFLFQGADPVQTISNSAAITAGREAVLRGFVVARDFGPLPNVKVTVKDHPEFGWTESREDGRFDLVVNGGERYTLRFTLNEFLESQRLALAPPLDYAVLDTVAMIGRSQRWYYADTTQSWHIVGRFESDANGDRYMYMHVPRGALATVTPVGGTPATFDKYRIRLKEFTVGSGGRDAMPGELPPTTAYTYCVDISLVEADSILDHHFPGGTAPEITFSTPIVTYVKEFLGLPVGTAVPSGYYSPARGVWVADPDGVILKILSIGGGYATLDTDGDGEADNATTLASAGIDSLELARMAANFAQNDVLWRVPVTHFSSHDYNYNYGSDPDAGGPAASGVGPGVPPIGDPEKTCNCVIENENRVLGESIPVSGTPYTLNYRSNRVPGDRASYWLRVPLTGSTVPTGLSRVHLVVDVAGRHYEKIYTGLGSNEWRMFTDWNGRDGNGRRVPGSVTATVRIGYEFGVSYATVKSGDGSGWGNSASTATRSGAAATGNRDGGNIAWSTQKVSLGAPSMASAGLGGWTLSPHHFYDPSGHGALYFGDGSTRYGEARRPTITKFAGNGSPPSGLPTGQQRLSLGLSPLALTFGPDGSLFAVAGGSTRPYIVRIRPDGTMVTWAGTGQSVTPSDTVVSGTIATSAKFFGGIDIAAGPDGSLYVTDEGWRQVYRISPTDTIYVLVGHYQAGYGSFVDGSVAASSALNTPTAVAVDRDGSVLVADDAWHRIVRITTGGLIRGVAGNGQTTPVGSAGKADSLAVYSGGGSDVSDITVDGEGNIYFLSDQRLYVIRPDGQMKKLPEQVPFIDHGPAHLALGPDGAVYIGQNTSESWNGVYRLEPDRMSITRLAGGYDMSAGGAPSNDFDDTEGVDGVGAVLNNVTGLAIGADGAVYVSETRPLSYVGIGGKHWGVRRIASEVPGTSLGEIVYPSQDGREVYYFTPGGRHLRTKDAWTGVTLYTFGYNAAGQLTSVTDANSLTTEIIRDANGLPQAIAGHFGHRDSLAVDANGYLSLVRNELSNEQYVLGHDIDGLLETYQNPRLMTQQFYYRTGSPGTGMTVQGDGRLETDTDAALADLALGYSVQDTLRTVTRTTELGRMTTYQITEYMNGLRRRLTRYPDNSYRYRSDSTNATVVPYGRVLREVGLSGAESFTYLKRDARFGMLSPVSAIQTTRLPSGRIRTTEYERAYGGSGQFTESITLNQATPSYTASFDSSTRLLTLATPEERISKLWLGDGGRPTKVESGTQITPVELGFDGSGRLWHVSQGERAWRYAYDERGRLETVTDTLGNVSSFKYDVADRESLLTLPGDRVVSFQFDGGGNLLGLTTPGGDEHMFDYSDVDLNDKYTPPPVSGIADPATYYAYNPDRQLTDVVRPDGGQIRLRYNSQHGWLDSLTIARGRKTYSYGSMGQLTSAASPDSVTSTYSWDSPLLARETWSGAVSGAVARTLNIAFAESTQTVVAGNDSSVVSYTYGDADGLLTGVSVAGVTETISRRAADGLITGTSVSAGGGTVTSWQEYNSFGELSTLGYTWPGGGEFQQSIDERDALGRITQVSETVDGETHDYAYHYDLAGRLDEVRRDGVLQRGYVYDDSLSGNGNRTKEKDGSGAVLAIADYDDQDRLTSYGGTAYEWTANGELARRIAPGPDTTRTTYDELGNLTGAHLPGVSGDSLNFVIDASNRRVSQFVNGQRTHMWLYANQLSVVAELDGSGALRHRYAYGTQAHVPDMLVHADTVYRLITDHLGSVRAVVRVSDGEVAQRVDYDAWGVRTLDTDPGWQSLGFVGGLTDTRTGLVRFGARDYEPGVGRWAAKDPVVLEVGSPNLYAYVSGDPLSQIDPSGLSPEGSGHCKPCGDCVGNCFKSSGGQWALAALGASGPFGSIPWLGRSKELLGSSNPYTSLASITLRGFGARSLARGLARKLNPAANVVFAGAAAYSFTLWLTCTELCRTDCDAF